ncbi:exodeoxyribonuclease VII small subunit [Belliella sp. DSM 107340]|uniref:Exodeoxyribonuclease VII small subunit n=1 Tax=Belliella calami TaxID=2923436 RepID=A0ABS9UND5_9BACT|nr:exodeoxyribonuclease VII small subunit [Belliella calami]MCH7398121.1 exodeoxyribonuclease VII small subunit [Belliella calami]
MESSNLSYDKALARIEEIVVKLESGEEGIDQLSSLVKEAAVLVKRCKIKLRLTEEEINKAFED